MHLRLNKPNGMLWDRVVICFVMRVVLQGVVELGISFSGPSMITSIMGASISEMEPPLILRSLQGIEEGETRASTLLCLTELFGCICRKGNVSFVCPG